MILSTARSSSSLIRSSSSCSAPLASCRPSMASAIAARLLVDLLAHEPVVAALLGGARGPSRRGTACASAGVAVEVGDRDALAGDRDDLVLAELERLAGVLDEGGDVGGQEVLAVAEADHQRRVAPGGDHPVGVLRVDRDQRERAVEPAADPLHRLGERAALARAPPPAGARRPRCRSRRPASWPAALELGAQLRRSSR